MDKETLGYYNKKASDFFDNTVDVNFTKIQDKFLSYLKPGTKILDFGCGSGRDTRYFLDKNYKVEAFDGSEEMCRLASDYTGIPVKHMFFNDFTEVDKYQGIWACSSILHLPYEELKEVFIKIARGLKDKGILYTSFKEGSYEGFRNGRYFTDLTEDKLTELVEETKVFEIIELWITRDVRPGRDERWLNVIMRKK